MDKFCEYNLVTNKESVIHYRVLFFGSGDSMKHQVVIDYIKNKVSDLIKDNKVYLGSIDNSRLLEWAYSDVQNFIKNLLRYGILCDEVRIKLEKFERDGDCIYDPIRSFLLAATPEECIRQKTIIYLQRDLGIPVNRIFVEESMAHTKKGARGRADIVVYRDDECTDALMIIECKAPHINVLGDEVFKQACGYREILNADYIMLVNGVEAIIYHYNNRDYFEVKDIPSFEELLKSKISIVEAEEFEEFKYEELMSDEFQEAFAENGDISEYTPQYIKGFALNLINLIIYKEIKNSKLLEKIGISEDCRVSMPHFGNSGGGNYQVWSHMSHVYCKRLSK